MASPLRIISSMATKQLLVELAASYQQAHPGQEVLVEAVGGVEAAKRVQAGEAFDVVVLAASVIGQLTGEGRVVQGSRTDLVRSSIHVAVKAGAPRPALDTADAVRQAVLAARSTGYSTGPSGVYLVKLFESWGIADAIKDRLVQAKPGVAVATLIARGEVELGFQQLSEMIHSSDIDVVGPLPAEIQSVTIFSGGVAASSAQPEAARQLLDYLAAPATAAAKRANGLEPA